MNIRYLNVGSWNIEHFGDTTDDNSENVYAIAEHIEFSGVDILALQELYVTGNDYKNSHIEEALKLVKEHTGCTWSYEIFPNRNENDKSQLCGVAWNESKVKKVGATYKIPVSYNATYENKTLWLWDRSPHAIKFTPGEGKTDIVIIPLHMKSNVGKSHVVKQTRYEEVKTLMDNLSNIESHFNDQDIIFIGDTNCKSSYEKAIQEFTDRGFEDLNSDDITTFVRGNKAPFDRIFVPRKDERNAFRYSRQYIMRSASPSDHDNYLSDHYLIKTMVKIRRDDD